MKTLTAVVALVFLFSSNILAEDVQTLDSFIEEALTSNPQIKAARAGAESSAKRPSQEGSLPNPIIGGRIKNVSFSEFTLGEDPRSDIQAFIAQEIPFPGKLSQKEKIALEESESQKWVADSVSRKVVAELKEAYYEWAFINKSIEITQRNKDLLKSFVKIAEVKYEVGLGIQQDVLKAQVELSGFIERLELLNQKNEIIEARIKKILNRPYESRFGNPEELTKTELRASLEDITQAASLNSPELKSSQELIDSREEALKLADKEYLPDFILGATYFNRSGGDLEDIWQLSLGLRVPLYFWRKEKFGVQEAALDVTEARENYEAARNNVLFILKDNFISARTAENLTELYKEGIIPQSTLSLESAISSYQVGEIDFLTLLNNLITLFNFELEYYEQLATFNKSLARIEEVTGIDLTLSNPLGTGDNTSITQEVGGQNDGDR
jgi:outer membrane protein TolC